MPNQGKKPESYESGLHRRSASSVYWAESSSTLTTSSQESADLESDEGKWCAGKMRRQRQKMEKLLVCYEQQRKCIAELEDYIDDLERAHSAKDQEISRLQRCKARDSQITALESSLQRQMVKDEQVEKNRMLSLINGQLRLYELERRRWQKQVQGKEQELLEEKEAFEEQIAAAHSFYKDKILQIELKWLATERNLADSISKLQRQKAELQEKNKDLSERLAGRNQFEEMLKLRRELSQRESQITSKAEKKETENQLLREQLEKAKGEIRKNKKENCRLKNELQTKMFDIEMEQRVASTLEAKRQKSARKQAASEDRIRADELAQQLKKARKELLQYEQKWQRLQGRNLQLEDQNRQLNGLFSQRKENEKKWESLRREQHQQIQHLNLLFKKIDFNI